MIGYWLTQPGAAAVTPADVSPELLFDATLSSLGFGLAAAVLTTLLVVPLAFLLVRYPGRLATLFERTVFLAQGIPGLVIALAIVSLAVHALQPLYQSATLLVDRLRDPVPAARARERARRVDAGAAATRRDGSRARSRLGANPAFACCCRWRAQVWARPRRWCSSRWSPNSTPPCCSPPSAPRRSRPRSGPTRRRWRSPPPRLMLRC